MTSFDETSKEPTLMYTIFVQSYLEPRAVRVLLRKSIPTAKKIEALYNVVRVGTLLGGEEGGDLGGGGLRLWLCVLRLPSVRRSGRHRALLRRAGGPRPAHAAGRDPGE